MKTFDQRYTFEWKDPEPNNEEDHEIFAVLDGKEYPLSSHTAMDSLHDIFEEHFGRPLSQYEHAAVWKFTEQANATMHWPSPVHTLTRLNEKYDQPYEQQMLEALRSYLTAAKPVSSSVAAQTIEQMIIDLTSLAQQK